ncbi:MAG: hypothetical protein KJ904_10230 [Alphaproteobacteria bacterium]|nr:hypothetical protein [Alphaproteobacteria bacterium]MBU0799217.1 hypothetical protein [Alphaproteobacteria bacterium]MBU0887532.1 hypothetical protein [Alphaproteobacteria bacterium]MBU1814769.1 hypothetical protein [Alphaproteobacteria bacterium]MBU2090831.1 hypothetical protein [Alphaproteobacteria bacterium]
MPLWKIVPTANAGDTRWLDYRRWQEVIVRADTSAQAVLLASTELGRPNGHVGNESPTNMNGLEDEKLYAVQRLEGEDMPGDIPGIVSAVPGTGPQAP